MVPIDGRAGHVPRLVSFTSIANDAFLVAGFPLYIVRLRLIMHPPTPCPHTYFFHYMLDCLN